MKSSDRRQFLKGAAATAALTATARAGDADGRITLGIIGPGGMGMNHLRRFAGYADVRIAYVCDPDSDRLAAAAKAVQEISGTAPKPVTDMRRIFEDKAVDGVVIATPDHWHAPAAVRACEAGKHVYVEKPASQCFREGRLMVEAARRHNRVVQVGTQSRSTKVIAEAMQRLHAGAIGEVLVAKAWNSQLRRSIGRTEPSDPPGHLDFDTWLGPAPETRYRPNMLHGIWRWWHAFGCGDIGNDGVHDIDIARWGLGVSRHPVLVTASGGKYFFDDDQEWPDTQTALFEYAPDPSSGRPRQLIFEQRIWSPYHQEGAENGNAFYGTTGHMILSKAWGWKLFEGNRLVEEGSGTVDLEAHHRDWLQCIRDNGTPRADILEGHLSAALCHLANIATRMPRKLRVDPSGETIEDDAESARMLGKTYRSGHWAALD